MRQIWKVGFWKQTNKKDILYWILNSCPVMGQDDSEGDAIRTEFKGIIRLLDLERVDSTYVVTPELGVLALEDHH